MKRSLSHRVASSMSSNTHVCGLRNRYSPYFGGKPLWGAMRRTDNAQLNYGARVWSHKHSYQGFKGHVNVPHSRGLIMAYAEYSSAGKFIIDNHSLFRRSLPITSSSLFKSTGFFTFVLGTGISIIVEHIHPLPE